MEELNKKSNVYFIDEIGDVPGQIVQQELFTTQAPPRILQRCLGRNAFRLRGSQRLGKCEQATVM